MNERIFELAKQADLIQWDSLPSGARTPDHESIVKARKFAELIVRECMKESWDEIVSDEDIAQEDDPLIREYLKGNNQGIVDAVIRFRNHFGVEE